MTEIFRILKPDGWAILQTPISAALDATYEDFSITDPTEKKKLSGQCDHVRIYAMDYVDRLKRAGFVVELFPMACEQQRLWRRGATGLASMSARSSSLPPPSKRGQSCSRHERAKGVNVSPTPVSPPLRQRSGFGPVPIQHAQGAQRVPAAGLADLGLHVEGQPTGGDRGEWRFSGQPPVLMPSLLHYPDRLGDALVGF